MRNFFYFESASSYYFKNKEKKKWCKIFFYPLKIRKVYIPLVLLLLSLRHNLGNNQVKLGKISKIFMYTEILQKSLHHNIRNVFSFIFFYL